MIRLSIWCLIFLLLLVCNNLYAIQLTQWWEIENLDTPESVLYDEQHNVIFISNVDGAPNEKDGKGYISVVSVNGEIENKYWIEGLNAPKGLARNGNLLYVSDLDTLVEINIDNGKILHRYIAPKAKFLNDVAVNNDDSVYVSDMVTNTIYQLKDKKFTVWLQDAALENPNGLLIENDDLIIGSWGKMIDGFATNIPGHLKRVSLITKEIESLGNGNPIGNLDGVESDGTGRYYVTDWLNGGLFLIDRTGHAEIILSLEKGSADHEVVLEKSLIIIPKMLEDKVTAYKIN